MKERTRRLIYFILLCMFAMMLASCEDSPKAPKKVCTDSPRYQRGDMAKFRSSGINVVIHYLSGKENCLYRYNGTYFNTLGEEKTNRYIYEYELEDVKE